MDLGTSASVAPRKKRASFDLIAGGIITAALILFVILGGTVFPAALRSAFYGTHGGSPALSAALILNIALLLLGWRRFSALQEQTEGRLLAERHALAIATQDFSTGLMNRAAFSQAGDRCLASSTSATLLVLDLDHFKKVNDHYGHAAGDDLLKSVATTIQKVSPADAICARLGGDEFAILLPGDHPETHGVAAEVADAISSALAQPIPVQGGMAQVGASIGIAQTTGLDSCFTALLRRSDIAMYQAKKSGRSRVIWFDAEMEAEVCRLNQLEADMRAGIGNGEFVPFYQPQYSLASGELHGFEVLARWNHPKRGVVEPTEFIPLAESTGLIASLSLSVMRQALSDARNWDPSLMVAINVSPIQLKDRLLDQRILKILTETGFPAGRLELEVTESALFEDLDLALSTIESLKRVGVTISLDDFGTGYSSLSHLKALPFDRIKIDRSFVHSMHTNTDSAAIVTAIASLARSLQLPITAEGIETEAVRVSLQDLGCSEGQGWFFGKPLTLEQVAARFPDVVLGMKDQQGGLAAVLPSEIEEIQLAERRNIGRRGSGRRSAAA